MTKNPTLICKVNEGAEDTLENRLYRAVARMVDLKPWQWLDGDTLLGIRLPDQEIC